MADQLVNPGERLSMEEEYVPSTNTYVEDGSIYSASTGTVMIKEGAIAVEPMKEIKKIDRGMLVLGKVTDNMKSVVFVEIQRMTSQNKEYLPLKDGKIIMRSRPPMGRGPMRGRGGERPREEDEKPCKSGDIVIARVIADETDIYVLGLASPEAGVIHASCSECGGPLEASVKPNTLFCNYCKRDEHRKLSIYYGKPEEIKKYFDNKMIAWK
ncbi:MAG TPA: hypothetical protein VL944_02490 [Candidatus Acidoferrum sp.]|nr:hypothetical protein [Candidatus Acidoferrum sp.]